MAVLCLGDVVFNQDENDETSVLGSSASCNCRPVAGYLGGGAGITVESSHDYLMVRWLVTNPKDKPSGVERDIQSLIVKESRARNSFFSDFVGS
jgi:hypothetical protein